ncbi:putative C6 transcription factor [Rosellinia necatrix]|uniref:Putative C6 transcription factor n=1 Tax=Rosellinia necatrix TaxID=77044 RepID=A0A1W2TFF3_ROSNE|nr:putative C6 transcription factor [Rosellinia necatrix]
MTPPGESTNTRGRRRSHHACLPCRPAEYAKPSSQEQTPEDIAAASEASESPAPGPERPRYLARHLSITHSESEYGDTRPGPADIATGIHLYFKYCHRQPIWCFEREDVTNYNSLPLELICSILFLTARFSNKRDHLQLYGHNVRPLIMLRIANGTVILETIESLCLLSYSFFLDGNISLGQFHVGLALQLCRSAMLDLESSYTIEDPTKERKKRLFWSLQILEQLYGRQTGVLSMFSDVNRPPYSSSPFNPMTPTLPAENQGTADSMEPGIWNTGLHLGWVWSRVRKFVSDCAHNILKEPWRHDSTYAVVQSDFMETENRIPICHRYDSVKFYARTVEELRRNLDYWAPWLKEQFTYHAIPTVLNHPFLYIVGAQHNPNLAIPNTFWKRSSELALLHATWIVRMIDMIVDKQVPLVDPFMGHIAAIAATVHLYYCCAAAAGLKQKSRTDFAKCRRFLKSFLHFSPACAALDRNLDTMTRIAGGSSQNIDMDEWIPSKLYLSVPLMWDILQFNCVADCEEIPPVDLLHHSIAPNIPQEDLGENSTLEIDVATSPEIKVDTADGGQDAPSLSRRANVKPDQAEASRQASRQASKQTVWHEPSSSFEPSDNLTFNTTPWLYADPSQFGGLGDLGWLDTQSGMNDGEKGAPWWEGGTHGNVQFSQF